ncbi:hypothetical protein BZL30_5581 [Mycobacterium kansasii]|uniref:Uncharacterized protein n=1 Tax=Mycobacterium kansasii TaxID=1768 RepID=A0A1V3WY00_MYCKA|nr:hypothetical protein BZL30_5581 [Mycobacterium kansasii]
MNLVLIARRPGPLESRSTELEDKYGVSVKNISMDLAARICWKRLSARQTSSTSDYWYTTPPTC